MQNKIVNTQCSTQRIGQTQTDVLRKMAIAGQKVVGSSQRIVRQKSPGNLQKTVINIQEVTNTNAQKVVVNTQSNQRVVLQKTPIQQKKLPASTSEAQIRRMCQGIGTIEVTIFA